MEAVNRWGCTLAIRLHKKLRAYKDLVMAAVTQSGFALEYASKKMRADKEVFAKMIREHGCTLECAFNELRVRADARQDLLPTYMFYKVCY